jgi:hypothetical protein
MAGVAFGFSFQTKIKTTNSTERIIFTVKNDQKPPFIVKNAYRMLNSHLVMFYIMIQ